MTANSLTLPLAVTGPSLFPNRSGTPGISRVSGLGRVWLSNLRAASRRARVSERRKPDTAWPYAHTLYRNADADY